MAIIDDNLELADGADFATEPGTSNVGDIIDLGSPAPDLGLGYPLYLHITVDTSGDGGAGAAGTTRFQLVSDGTTTIATDGTQTIHFTSDIFLGTELDQGDHLEFMLPVGEPNVYERYLGLQIVQAVEGEDDLVCSAWISSFPGTHVKLYPQATVAV